MSREAGKGSGRRPSEVSKEVVDANWDRIFSKKNTNVDNDIEKYSKPGPSREYTNEWVAASPPAEIFDPYGTINS